ncbi:Peptidoglycan/LPS O-acetylase OafA/YrhL, contains acyltransferase and SGNH-hydrolase domains [Roseateles sp. YR242]|uniref:acyltransferase family protein n=1 Tax=Roseateles sp. YR242 TaxID=1855305 RepID=UPI0008B9830F|nr:acyltransferase [Roseateles sp. YR242]SEL82103.1 Peptidoglycan/LPS O-acetylase OafA/YrhL, contains acyltransferase and SGNH-hydrolase domains [Roseateles sp. YR242]
MSNQRARIAGLDGVRALCVLLVFTEHFVFGGHNLGGLGVKVFFALSGFLIVGILHGQRAKVEAGASTAARELRSFWVSRSLRIFPIYYLVLTLLLAKFLLKGVPLHTDGLRYYFVFLGNVYIQYKSHAWSNISHLWSISVEQHFYLLASPLLLWTSAARHHLITLALLAVSVAAAVVDFANYENVPQPYLPDLPFFAFMACGALLALARAAGKQVLTPALLAAVFLVGAVLFADASAGAFTITSAGALRGLRELGALMICFAVLAYIPAAQEGQIVRALEFAPLRYLGTISYGFYVYHYFFPNFLQYADRLTWLPYASVFLVAAQFLATCVVAALSWEVLERRLLSFKKRRQPGAGGAAVGAVPG